MVGRGVGGPGGVTLLICPLSPRLLTSCEELLPPHKAGAFRRLPLPSAMLVVGLPLLSADVSTISSPR